MSLADRDKAVISTIAEAKLGETYINAKKQSTKDILQEMGHQQLSIPMDIDNSTIADIINIKQQNSTPSTKAMGGDYIGYKIVV